MLAVSHGHSTWTPCDEKPCEEKGTTGEPCASKGARTVRRGEVEKGMSSHHLVGPLPYYSQTVAAGTVLTGNDGVVIVTDVPAVIPAGNPPAFGITTVS